MLDEPVIRGELGKILASPLFSNAPRMSRFLRFVVEETLAGGGERIKEYSIALEVFDKNGDYDPHADSTVRTEASKLRSRLQRYYEAVGQEDPVIISIPKGGYVPVFASRPALPDMSIAPDAKNNQTQIVTPKALRWRSRSAAFVLLATAGSVFLIAWMFGHGVSGAGKGQKSSPSKDAYRLYATAESYAVDGTQDKLQYAIQYLNLALAADGDYALAHAALSLACSELALLETVPASELLSQAKAQAVEAMRLDSSLAESHHALARALLLSDYDWQGADREFRRSLSIDPAYVAARYSYARMCLNPRGLHDRAAEQLQEGLKKDPFSAILNSELGSTDLRRGRIEDAIGRFQKNLAIYPESPGLLTQLAIALESKSQYDEALPYLLHAHRSVPDSAWIGSHLAICYVQLGQRDAALTTLKDLTKQGQSYSIPEYAVASVYAALGEADTAFEHLERAYSQRSVQLLWLKIDRRLQPLRPDPRFASLLKRVHLAE
jgi:tetratricopeptide (TPR) repeat protein